LWGKRRKAKGRGNAIAGNKNPSFDWWGFVSLLLERDLRSEHTKPVGKETEKWRGESKMLKWQWQKIKSLLEGWSKRVA